MGDRASDLVYRHALGLGEGMIKASTAVNELLMIADRDRATLEQALAKAQSEADAEISTTAEDSPDDSDAPTAQAPALLAVRLLQQTLQELDR